MMGANLTGSSAIQTDFMAADLTGAILNLANLSASRLERAKMGDTSREGTQLSGAILPDGSISN
jgi:uncharacterized protein YjbI with pentapeptide repeats